MACPEWIKGVITKAYPTLNCKNCGGVDLDGNGKIEENEKFGDLNENGANGDCDDFRIFYEKNKTILTQKIPFLSWGQAFSTNNILHDAFFIFSKTIKPELIQRAYEKMTKLLEVDLAQERQGLTPRQQLPLVYDLIKQELGVSLNAHQIHFLPEGLEKGKLDCDTSGLAVLAITEEYGWPVSPVELPGHMFLRWVDDKESFNAKFR